ncbi:hypothetical protein C2E23DRAFT_138412 [Lenzites betulinus]|nr:hypothetical protein C2E23DRAFT_138412 [Lenzites betulinus]
MPHSTVSRGWWLASSMCSSSRVVVACLSDSLCVPWVRTPMHCLEGGISYVFVRLWHLRCPHGELAQAQTVGKCDQVVVRGRGALCSQKSSEGLAVFITDKAVRVTEPSRKLYGSSTGSEAR